jgi:hypothetical protein
MNERIDAIYKQVLDEACENPLYRFAELVRQDEREQAEKQTHTDHPMRHWDRTCPACVAEAEKQEPKAWIYEGNLHIFDPTDWAIEPESVQPLYTAPPKREWVNLTDEQIEKIVDMNTRDDGGFDLFCDGHSIASAVINKLQELNT